MLYSKYSQHAWLFSIISSVMMVIFYYYHLWPGHAAQKLWKCYKQVLIQCFQGHQYVSPLFWTGSYIFYCRGQWTFSLKGQILNILALYNLQSLAIIKLRCYSAKAVMNNMWMNEWSCPNKALFKQLVMRWILPAMAIVQHWFTE